MDRDADLNAALKFVIDRIGEEASQSGEPLSSEQRRLLQNLPHTDPTTALTASDPENLTLVPRDLNYERVCGLARQTYLEDLRQNRKTFDWEFASAVALLNDDPLWSLLHYAGVRNRRPWWDRFLLVFAALTWIAITLATFFVIGIDSEPWTAVKWTGAAIVIGPLTILLGLIARRIQRWQLEQEIERCRSRF